MIVGQTDVRMALGDGRQDATGLPSDTLKVIPGTTPQNWHAIIYRSPMNPAPQQRRKYPAERRVGGDAGRPAMPLRPLAWACSATMRPAQSA